MPHPVASLQFPGIYWVPLLGVPRISLDLRGQYQAMKFIFFNPVQRKIIGSCPDIILVLGGFNPFDKKSVKLDIIIQTFGVAENSKQNIFEVSPAMLADLRLLHPLPYCFGGLPFHHLKQPLKKWENPRITVRDLLPGNL